MKFKAEYSGKWVAIKNEEVVASDITLKKLTKKIKNEANDKKNLRFTLIPKGLIAG